VQNLHTPVKAVGSGDIASRARVVAACWALRALVLAAMAAASTWQAATAAFIVYVVQL
jgi:hypothetical protein